MNFARQCSQAHGATRSLLLLSLLTILLSAATRTAHARRTCAVPTSPSFSAGGKDCPGDASSCLNSNTKYASLALAWAACGTVTDCATISVGTADNALSHYQLRRATDPIHSDGKGYQLPYLCGTDYNYGHWTTTEYKKELVAKSCATQGWVPIATTADCEKAAASLGLSGTQKIVLTFDTASKPPGCIFITNPTKTQLEFNTRSSSTWTGTWTDLYNICEAHVPTVRTPAKKCLNKAKAEGNVGINRFGLCTAGSGGTWQQCVDCITANVACSNTIMNWQDKKDSNHNCKCIVPGDTCSSTDADASFNVYELPNYATCIRMSGRNYGSCDGTYRWDASTSKYKWDSDPADSTFRTLGMINSQVLVADIGTVNFNCKGPNGGGFGKNNAVLSDCSGDTNKPTAAPTTSAPTNPDDTEKPTVAPTSASPTTAATFEPTAVPSLLPTATPTTAWPTNLGDTPAPTATPTAAPVTAAPTAAPVTAAPTAAPTTATSTSAFIASTNAPTPARTLQPVTHKTLGSTNAASASLPAQLLVSLCTVYIALVF